jgi:hypothetical protein
LKEFNLRIFYLAIGSNCAVLDVIVNTQNIDKKIAQARKLGGDMSVPMHQAGDFIVGLIDQSFVQQRDPYNQAWVPLADSTLRARQRRGQGSAILQATGAMRASLGFESDAHSVLAHINAPAEYHQEGSWRLPQRRIFPISFGQRYLPKAWTDGFLAIFEKYVAGMFK